MQQLGNGVADLEFVIKLAVVGVALASIMRLLLRSERQALHMVWAVFCGSMAIVMIEQVAGESSGAYRAVLVMAGCATCNAFWLVARALFR